MEKSEMITQITEGLAYLDEHRLKALMKQVKGPSEEDIKKDIERYAEMQKKKNF
jgi:hypothetical protein